MALPFAGAAGVSYQKLAGLGPQKGSVTVQEDGVWRAGVAVAPFRRL